MDYNLSTSSGTITLPSQSTLLYKGLKLVGRDSKDWNEPIQQNFVTLVDKVETKMDKVVNQHLIPDVADTYTLGSEDKPFKDLYVGANSFYVNGQKVISDDGGTIVISADDDRNIQIKAKGDGNIEFFPSGTGNLKFKGTVEIATGKMLKTSDGSTLRLNQSIQVDGDINSSGKINGVTMSELALKTDIPDISGKLDKADQKTLLSQMTNDVGFLTTHQDISALANAETVANDISRAIAGVRGGVLATHDTLAKLKTDYERLIDALRVEINAINNLLSSDDATLDTFQEIVSFVKANKRILDSMSVATEYNYGWMSASDKVKLNAIESEANHYVHPDFHTIEQVEGLTRALDERVAKSTPVSAKVGAGIIIY